MPKFGFRRERGARPWLAAPGARRLLLRCKELAGRIRQGCTPQRAMAAMNASHTALPDGYCRTVATTANREWSSIPVSILNWHCSNDTTHPRPRSYSTAAASYRAFACSRPVKIRNPHSVDFIVPQWVKALTAHNERNHLCDRATRVAPTENAMVARHFPRLWAGRASSITRSKHVSFL
jgi:hypothetical protein